MAKQMANTTPCPKGRLVRGLTSRRLSFWCAITVLLLSLNGLVLFQNVRTIVDHDRAVRHSQDVLSALENVLTSLDDAETGERGYIITGQRAYLQPYFAATKRIGPQTDQLASLASDTQQLAGRLPQLRVLIAAKLTELQLTIADLPAGAPFDAAARLPLTDEDKNTMDGLRSTIGAMKSEEFTLLDQRSVQAQRATNAAIVTLVVATVADVVLVIGTFALIRRGLARSVQVAAERERLLGREQAARIAAEDAVRARDTFLSLASHELKTPLTSLLGNAQLLRRGLAGDDEVAEPDRRKLDAIIRQGERLRLLTDQLLDSSRLQYGQLSIELEPLDLRALVDRVVEEARATTTSHVLEVRGTVDPVIVRGDALRLEQVLQNLIGNAIKYSPLGGDVVVTVAHEAGEARVAVTDVGIGIPQAAQAQLFERFYRAPNATSAGTIGGLGIGLYVVREIVTQHGGHVEVFSEEGAGSTFAICFPAVGEPALPVIMGA